jgi:hypothetical protein
MICAFTLKTISGFYDNFDGTFPLFDVGLLQNKALEFPS